MKRFGRLAVTLAGIAALIGVCYNVFIQQLSGAYKDEVNYFFSITPDAVLNKKTEGNGDSVAESVIKNTQDNAEDIEGNSGVVLDTFLDKLPFIKEVGDKLLELSGKDSAEVKPNSFGDKLVDDLIEETEKLDSGEYNK